jgi:NAD(P)-dependent dehydrogenase (short-subunit alcohol dehydrogenase family)
VTTLQNATVLVTGANGGLGREFVRQSLERGARRVWAAARRTSFSEDARVMPLELDVTSSASIRAAADRATDATIVVNNAGIAGGSPIATASIEEVRRVFDVNVFGALEVAQAFAPVLAANGGGALVDVHSALSWLARSGAYSASKAAIWSITNSLRLELRGQGTHVLGAHLGYADTPMTARLDVEKADPAEIVAAILDGLEQGEHEVLADDTSRMIRSRLADPLPALYPELR